MPNVLILGATSDMAVATAKEFAKNKFSVSLAARNMEHLGPIQQDLGIRYGVGAKAYHFDACDFDSHGGFYSSLEEKPDVVACVFGHLGDQYSAQKDNQEALRILHTNFTGAVSILNIIANDFEARQAGTIIGISSVAGDRGRQTNYLYGSAKAGFSAYLSGLRNRLFKAKVHVITVKPGFVYTKMTEGLDLPKLLTASPEEVAKDIYGAYKKSKNTIYTKWFWRWIMLIIKLVPEPIFKKMKL